MCSVNWENRYIASVKSYFCEQNLLIFVVWNFCERLFLFWQAKLWYLKQCLVIRRFWVREGSFFSDLTTMDFQSAMETFAEAWVAANTKPEGSDTAQVSRVKNFTYNLNLLTLYNFIAENNFTIHWHVFCHI